MSPRRRPPYWTLVAFAALMALPSPWFPVAFATIAAASIAVRVARARSARRAAVEAGSGDGVLLGGAGDGRPLRITDHQLSAHGLILGASGAGKSTTLLRILTNRIERGLPVVAIDLKGSPSFANALATSAAQAGRPFLLWTPDGPAHWNPLARGNPTELKDKLISTERFTEPHYQRAAERYLQLALTVLARARPERPPTLDEVVRLTDSRRLSALLRGVDVTMRTDVQDYLASLTPDQVSAVQGIGTRLALLTESHTGRFLGEPGPGEASIDLLGALRGEGVVLFSLNSSRYGHLAAQLGTMVVQDLVSAAGERLGDSSDGSPAQALVAVDEFSALGADHLVGLFARGRESRMGVVVATQEFADLDRAARGLREQVTGNTAVKIIHRQDVFASAEMVARMIGTKWEWEETRHFGGGPGRGGFGPRGTRRQVERYRVHPNEIMGLRVGEAVVISKLPTLRVSTGSVHPPVAALSSSPPEAQAPRVSWLATRLTGRRAKTQPPPARPRPDARRLPPRREGPEL